MCDKVFAYSKSSTTLPLIYHLRTQHASVFETGAKSKSDQPSLSSFGVGPQRPCSEMRQEKITALLVKVIVANMLPISLVAFAPRSGARRHAYFLVQEYAVGVA